MKHQKAFTLIELLIAVVIVGILTAIAVPSYQHYVLKSNRSAAESFMLSAANKEEQILLDLRCYVSVASKGNFPNAPTAASPGISLSVPDKVINNYDISIGASTCPPAAAPFYTITATPIGQQANDTQCPSLTLKETGKKNEGLAAGCW